MSTKRISECRLCGGDVKDVLNLGETPLANSFLKEEDLTKPEPHFPLVLTLCQKCGSCQLRDTVDPDLLFKNYLYESSTSKSFRQHFKDYAIALKSFLKLSEGHLVVDIGSNDGILLKPLQELDLRAIGVEPATNLAIKCQEEGLKVYNDYFTKALIPQLLKDHGPAKVITANNVFAHVDNLHEIIDAVQIALDKDGVFVFEVAHLLETFKENIYDNNYHEHIFSHTVKSLKRLFMMHRMDLFHVQPIPTHGGSIRCFAQMANGQYVNWPSVQDIIDKEEAWGLFNLEAWKTFSEKINENKVKLKDKLLEMKKNGARICAYGAPAKTTTLLHFLDIGTDIIDFIVEDAPLKHHMYLPGKHIPILPKGFEFYHKSDCCLVTAWNFWQEIINNNQDYPGKWINPITLDIV